jgi:hypothetical protein
MLTRRHFLAATAASLTTLTTLATRRALFAEAAPIPITVYKDPGCECCARWIKHLAANGFAPTARDVANVDEIKRTMGVPKALQSCHTAVVGRYVVEGHVPADVIKKLVAEKSTALGLAAPGMPMGSPGMEGGTKDKYDIIAFERNGTSRVYASR